MPYFRQIFLISCLSAFVASLVFSLYQWFLVNPIIFVAELYELAEPLDLNGIERSKSWTPNDGIERSLYTLLANFLVSLAYSLLLVCGMVLRGSSSMLKGLVWGMAAYLCVFISPALGLPPEIPGMQTADLMQRQTWWLLTASLTAIGLAVLAFSSWYYKGAGLILILLPHLMGAPVAEVHGFSYLNTDAVIVLTKLWHQFILQTSIANALLWFIIGISTGFLCHKFIDAVPPLQPNKLTKA